MNTSTLRERLRRAPFNFLSAFSSPMPLYKFNDEWLALREDVDKALQLSQLTVEDTTLAHATATLVATFSQGILEADDEAAKRTAVFVDEIEEVFAQLTITTRHPPPHAHRGSRCSSRPTPSYMPAAYSWIIQNIHNPYPSIEVKERIARDAACPLRVVTDWFKAVRRHIGWVDMCKEHFQGSRASTIQAAKHVFIRTGSIQLSPSSDIVSQFEAIRTRLRGLYPMVDDNGDLSDSTDDSSTPSLLQRRFHSGQSPYTRSWSSGSTPSLIFSTDDEDNHSLISFAGEESSAGLGKRKNLTEDDESRPLKRNRSGFIIAEGLVKDAVGVVPVPSYLTQPISSRKRRLSVAATTVEDASTTSPAPSSQCDSPLLRVPKRRLSVSDTQPAPKRPCLPPAVGPRKQAVSTPLPIAHQTTLDIDDWFRTFELPDTSLSVELFSNWDVTVENDVFYDSLYDGALQSESPDPLNVTPLSDVYQSSTLLDLGVSSAIDPSILDISSAFTESPAPISTPSLEPITATGSSAFDLLDAFLSTVNAQSAEPQSTQSSLSPYAEPSLDDSIDIFGDLVDP